VTEEDDLADENEKPFADGKATVKDDGTVEFAFDEPKSPSTVDLQLKESPDVTVSLLDENDEPVKTIVSFRRLLRVWFR
jgi:hypothetical protein